MATPHIAVAGYSEFWDSNPDAYRAERFARDAAEVQALFRAEGFQPPVITDDQELRYAKLDLIWLREQVRQARAYDRARTVAQ